MRQLREAVGGGEALCFEFCLLLLEDNPVLVSGCQWMLCVVRVEKYNQNIEFYTSLDGRKEHWRNSVSAWCRVSPCVRSKASWQFVYIMHLQQFRWPHHIYGYSLAIPCSSAIERGRRSKINRQRSKISSDRKMVAPNGEMRGRGAVDCEEVRKIKGPTKFCFCIRTNLCEPTGYRKAEVFQN